MSRWGWIGVFGVWTLAACDQLSNGTGTGPAEEIVVVGNGADFAGAPLLNAVVADVKTEQILSSHIVQEKGLLPIQSDLKRTDPVWGTLEGLVIDWMIVSPDDFAVFRVHSKTESLPCRYLEQKSDQTYQCSKVFESFNEDLVHAPVFFGTGLIFLRSSGELMYSPDFIARKSLAKEVKDFWVLKTGQILWATTWGEYHIGTVDGSSSPLVLSLGDRVVVRGALEILRIRVYERILSIAKWSLETKSWSSLFECQMGSSRLSLLQSPQEAGSVILLFFDQPQELYAFDERRGLTRVFSGPVTDLSVHGELLSFTTKEGTVRICYFEPRDERPIGWTCPQVKLPAAGPVLSQVFSPEGHVVVTREAFPRLEIAPDPESPNGNEPERSEPVIQESELVVFTTDQLKLGTSKLLRREMIEGEVKRLRILDGEKSVEAPVSSLSSNERP